MSIKRIKPHVNSYCTFCKQDGVFKEPAKWRISLRNTVACEKHKGLLEDIDSRDSGYYTEADYQTWLRL